MRSRFTFCFFTAVLLAAAQTGQHPFTAHDWTAIHNASPAAVAPDGTTILVLVTWGGEKGPTQEEWRLIAKDGGNPRKLELPEHFHPSGFTRDGASLYGTYQVNKLAQLAVFPLAGIGKNSTPSLIVTLPAGVHTARLSPEGSRFALLADPRPPDDQAEVHTVVEPDQTSLYVVNADGTGGKWWCGELKQISGIAWSADANRIAVLSAAPKIGYHSMHSYLDVCSASGAHRAAEIATAADGIAWADGGRDLAFLSTTTSVITPDHVWSVPASGGTPVDRTPKLNGSATSIVSDPHGKVWVSIEHGVQNEIDSYADGELTTAFRWPAGYVSTPAFSELASAAPQLVFDVGDPTHAANLAVPDGSALRRITTESDEQLAKIDLGPVRVVHWTSQEGIPLEGIATFPAGFTEGRRYPFLVLPHGGPESNDRLSLDDFARFIAGLGYVVIQPEYRGSTGYGSEFLNAIYQHFGDRAYRDVDSATDFAIAQGWADPNRLAIFGWSAGGFMTSWTVTQTGRYKAAVEGAGITDWAPFLWTSDVQQFDYDGRWPEEDLAAFSQFSAVLHANRVTTPLLILHGAADLRVPTFQGREFYEVLAARGKTVRMVTYPGSGHFPRL
jgi:dipeptidyl aminopeptidase/acylaminoacyl peptidase